MAFIQRSISTAQGPLLVSTLGLGGAAIGGLYTAVATSDAQQVIAAALASGVTYVDTAPYYGFGRSERLIGDVLREASTAYVLSTKVGRLLKPGALADSASYGWPNALPFTPVFDYSYDAVMRSFEDSLQRLGLAQIDILYLHDIGVMTHGTEHEALFKMAMSGGYRALAELRAAGLIKAIGLGVNEWEVCKAALDHGDWDVFLLAGRYTLLEQSAAEHLFPACLASNTAIVIGGPFNSGILVGGDTWNYAKAPAAILHRVQQLKQVCQQFAVSLPAAALQFPLGQNLVKSVIPGVRHVGEWQDILHWSQETIPAAFWQALKTQGLLADSIPVPQANPYQA